MNFDVVQNQIYTRLGAMTGLRTAYTEQGSISVGEGIAVLSYPTEIDPHGTYNKGMARMGMQLSILVGRPSERTTPERLAKWTKDSGSTSVMVWLESEDWFHDEFDVLTVLLITFGEALLNDVPYAAAFFDLDIVGSGS